MLSESVHANVGIHTLLRACVCARACVFGSGAADVCLQNKWLSGVYKHGQLYLSAVTPPIWYHHSTLSESPKCALVCVCVCVRLKPETYCEWDRMENNRAVFVGAPWQL